MSVRHAVGLPNVGIFGSVRRFMELAVLAEDSSWDGVHLWDQEEPVGIVGEVFRACRRRTSWCTDGGTAREPLGGACPPSLFVGAPAADKSANGPRRSVVWSDSRLGRLGP